MASALVLGPSPGSDLGFSWRTDGRLHSAIHLQWAPPLNSPRRRYWEPSQERMLIRFDPELQSQVMGEIGENARVVCAEALAKAGWHMQDVEAFVTHQPMSWYGPYLMDILGLPDGTLCDSFAEYANINSACIPASLHEAKRSGKLRRGTRTLIFGPAAGYTFGAVALRWLTPLAHQAPTPTKNQAQSRNFSTAFQNRDRTGSPSIRGICPPPGMVASFTFVFGLP